MDEIWKGPSSLTRGKRRRLQLAGQLPGLIPAHSGKTTNRGARATGTRAHPRSRGENLGVFHRGRGNAGSSTLTQGKHTQVDFLHPPVGLIPAHAGKTSTSNRRRGRGRAHPRSYGENRKSLLPTASQYGSSPLMRGKLKRSAQERRGRGLIPAHAGKLIDVLVGQTRSGLIPAHAGKTAWRLPVVAGFWAHPRSRGENWPGLKPAQRSPGSPPLTRGKRVSAVGFGAHPGLIPAHAGKTRFRRRPCRRRPAHPRSRGENRWGQPPVSLSSGSSPLMRGKCFDLFPGRVHGGLIPAYAGKPSSGSRRASGGRAHPRSCGENTS